MSIKSQPWISMCKIICKDEYWFILWRDFTDTLESQVEDMQSSCGQDIFTMACILPDDMKFRSIWSVQHFLPRLAKTDEAMKVKEKKKMLNALYIREDVPAFSKVTAVSMNKRRDRATLEAEYPGTWCGTFIMSWIGSNLAGTETWRHALISFFCKLHPRRKRWHIKL